MKELKTISKEELIQLHSMLEMIQNNFITEGLPFNLNIDEYYLQAKALNPQQYGIAIQKHFSTLLGYETVPQSQDRGDFKTNENEFVEFKTSYIDQFSRNLNIKHIRLWQELDWFYVFGIFINNDFSIDYKLFKLTKEEMEEECRINNAVPTNMTKGNHQQNTKVELGFSVDVGSLTYKRWEQKYLRKNFDIKELSEKRLSQLKTYDEREEFFIQIDERNKELESKLVELYSLGYGVDKTEEKNPIDVVFFCIENNITLTQKQSRILAFMMHDGMIDRETFKKHYSINNLFEHERILLEEFAKADCRKSRRGKITKTFLQKSGISAYIQSEYGIEIQRRMTKSRKQDEYN